VLDRALEEAGLRRAPVRVLTTWQARYTDIHDPRAVADINRLTRVHLEQRLGRSRRLHPELQVEAVAAGGKSLNYLAAHEDQIQLVVVPQDRRSGLAEVAGPAAHAALHDTDCSVMICERHGPL
jgi:nucleotide-binding universal stress UspA family protein